MTFQGRIRASISLHDQLVSTLSVTSDASREVRETSHYITELQYKIKTATKNLNGHRLRVERLRSGYEGLRDGSTKRLFSKVSGKTDELLARTTHAELEYQDAFEEQAKANKQLETLQQNLTNAQHSLSHLKDQVAIHTATLSELDSLYSSIFSLPHGDYPQETAAAQEIVVIQLSISDLQTQIDSESRVLKLLANARKSLIWSHAAIQNAQDTDRNKGGPFNEHHLPGLSIIRNAMSTAQLHAMQADSAYSAAQLIQPSIRNMRGLKILEESFLLATSYRADVNLLLDTTELTSRIGKCGAEMKPVVDEVGRENAIAKGRMQRFEAEKKELEDEARDILRSARQEVIGLIVEGRVTSVEAGHGGVEDGIQAPLEPPGYSP